MVNNKNLSDEFEFKSITDGLGFHKKVVSLQQEIQKSSTVKSEIGSQVPNVPTGLVKPKFHELISAIPGSQIFEEETEKSEKELVRKALERDPLPEQEVSIPRFKFQPYSSIPTIRTPEEQKNTTEKSLLQNDRIIESKIEIKHPEIQTVIPEAPALITLQEIPFHIGPILFDSIVVIGLACLFSVGLMLGANVDIITVLSGASKDVAAQIGFGVLIFSIIELYVIVVRSVFGSTLGEWAFDIQLGKTKQHTSALYPMLVLIRTVLVAAIGFVLLPFISAVFDKDITGRICGLKLYRNY